MSTAKNLADLLEAGGDVKLSSLDNAPAPTKTTIDALGITASSVTGTQASAIISNTAKVTNYNQTKADIEALGIAASSITGALPAISGANLTGIETVTKSTTAPSSPAQGDMWFDTTTGVTSMKVWSGSDWDQMSNKFSATGGTVTTYSSGGIQYKVHTFTTSGTLAITGTGSVDVLVVAGGGGGGFDVGGGGGAGGYYYGTSISVSAGSINVTVGGGGAKGTGINAYGGNGGDSTFGSTTVTGGGAGGSWSSDATAVGRNGGSGGGANRPNSGIFRSGGSHIGIGLGHSGGNAGVSGNYAHCSAAGGGAGGAGSNALNGTNVAGGLGLYNSISGTNVYYAKGGDGSGQDSGNWANPPANTGEGGHGAGTSGNAGASGIVIVRYTV